MAARRTRSRISKAQQEFVSEAEEVLEALRSDLARLEDQRAVRGHAEVDPDLVNRIFRSAHSLKGISGMFGFDAMSALTHHLEDVLDGLRMGRIDAASPAVAMIDEAVALATELLGHAGDPSHAEADARAVDAMLRRIDAALEGPGAAASEAEPQLDLDPSILRALTEYEEHRLDENIRKGRHISLVDTSFEIASFEEGLAEVSQVVREVGEVVSTLPSPGDAPESQIRFSLLVATQIDAESLARRIDAAQTTVRIVLAGASEDAPAEAEEASLASMPIAQDDAHAADAAVIAPAGDAAAEPAEIESLKSLSDTVRVDIRKLDELMTLVGELVLQRAAVEELAQRLASDPQTHKAGVELGKIHKALARKLSDLQAGVLDVRMVPLRQVFDKLSRVARRLMRDLDKQVRLDFKGADTELDKLIVEELVDPLVHLVRNAFDHAIEPQDERRAAGKPAEGFVCVAASQRGNHVVIEVSDDGRGIDASRVLARAIELGLVDDGRALTPREVLGLVFEPGFSTREAVTETSGRGVGMDVVRANVTALGGAVDIESQLGAGTTIALTLPITLAIIQALIVGVGEQRFAVPLNSVLETLLVDASTIQRSEGRELLDLRGEPLVLRRLAKEFEIAASASGSALYVVVLGLGDQRMGLVVDRLEGQQDTVIKPIQGPVRPLRGIVGATELGDDTAILVLDVASLVEDAVRRREAA